jgi:hypothetical protein
MLMMNNLFELALKIFTYDGAKTKSRLTVSFTQMDSQLAKAQFRPEWQRPASKRLAV